MEARKIIITGGATRIGAAIAKKLSGPNKEIIIHYNKSKSKAESLKKELQKKGTKIYLIKGDLSKETDVSKIVKFAKLKLKYFDCLINNASLFENDKLENFTTKNWGKHLRTNLRTPALLSKEFAKNIKGKSNNIINIIDQRVFKLTPYFFSYTISKTGLYTLTKTSATSLAPRIRVNGIAPGVVKTRWVDGHEDFVERLAGETPLGRVATAEDVAEVAYSLIANAGFVTGQNIIVDGGTVIG